MLLPHPLAPANPTVSPFLILINYGILLSKEYQKDSNTKMKVSNTITADGKSILKSEVFENGSQKTVTSYTYNSDGTVASQINLVLAFHIIN